jgi:hypothetical protein
MAAVFLKSIADGYNVHLPPHKDDCTFDWNKVQTSFIPALRSHFDSRFKDIMVDTRARVAGTGIVATDHAALIQRFDREELNGLVVSQAVASGLLTYEVAKNLKESVELIADMNVESGLKTYRAEAGWYSWSRLAPRLASYAMLAGSLFLLYKNYGAHLTAVEGGVISAVCMGMAAFFGELVFAADHRRTLPRGEFDASRRALQTARNMLTLPYLGPKPPAAVPEREAN